MSESGPRTDPFSDIISLVAGPIAAVIRSFDQLRRGSDELLRGLENFNTTMATLNDTAQRVNGLLNDVEEPIRVMIPQLTRTLRTADEISERISGPIDRVIPGLDRLADMLDNDTISSLPTDVGTALEAVNDLVTRLSPLSQVAETASGMFGIKWPGAPAKRQDAEPHPDPAPPKRSPATKPAAKQKSAEKKPPGNKRSGSGRKKSG